MILASICVKSQDEVCSGNADSELTLTPASISTCVQYCQSREFPSAALVMGSCQCFSSCDTTETSPGAELVLATVCDGE